MDHDIAIATEDTLTPPPRHDILPIEYAQGYATMMVGTRAAGQNRLAAPLLGKLLIAGGKKAKDEIVDGMKIQSQPTENLRAQIKTAIARIKKECRDLIKEEGSPEGVIIAIREEILTTLLLDEEEEKAASRAAMGLAADRINTIQSDKKWAEIARMGNKYGLTSDEKWALYDVLCHLEDGYDPTPRGWDTNGEKKEKIFADMLEKLPSRYLEKKGNLYFTNAETRSAIGQRIPSLKPREQYFEPPKNGYPLPYIQKVKDKASQPQEAPAPQPPQAPPLSPKESAKEMSMFIKLCLTDKGLPLTKTNDNGKPSPALRLMEPFLTYSDGITFDSLLATVQRRHVGKKELEGTIRELQKAFPGFLEKEETKQEFTAHPQALIASLGTRPYDIAHELIARTLSDKVAARNEKWRVTAIKRIHGMLKRDGETDEEVDFTYITLAMNILKSGEAGYVPELREDVSECRHIVRLSGGKIIQTGQVAFAASAELLKEIGTFTHPASLIDQHSNRNPLAQFGIQDVIVDFETWRNELRTRLKQTTPGREIVTRSIRLNEPTRADYPTLDPDATYYCTDPTNLSVKHIPLRWIPPSVNNPYAEIDIGIDRVLVEWLDGERVRIGIVAVASLSKEGNDEIMRNHLTSS